MQDSRGSSAAAVCNVAPVSCVADMAQEHTTHIVYIVLTPQPFIITQMFFHFIRMEH